MILSSATLGVRLSFLIGFGSLLLASETPSLNLMPSRIEMDSFYSGGTVTIKGRIAAGSEAVVVVRGEDKEEVFNKKARFGPIWASAGKVRISGVPSLFLCFSAKPVSKLLNRETITERLLDTTAIVARMRVEPAQEGGTDDPIRSNYLALKEEDGIYKVDPNGVQLGETENGRTHYTVEFNWPKKAPPASYEVRILECRGGEVVSQASAPL
jgi:hypothetical protein